MKGISAIIVVILFLLISVTLATVLYFWFSSTLKSVMGGVEAGVESSTSSMNTEISIINAKNTSLTDISVTVRNSGTSKIDLDTLVAFVDDRPASVKVCKGMYGDVTENNKIDTGDQTLVLQYISGLTEPNYCQQIKADVDGDSSITDTDATYIGNYIIHSSPYGRTGQRFSLDLGVLDVGETATFTIISPTPMSTCDHILRISVAPNAEASRTISC